MREIIVRQFRSGMALNRENEFVPGHAGSIILDHDQAGAAVAQGCVDARGACVDRVFDQFLHRRGRAFDHLAGGDSVNNCFRQTPEPPQRCGMSHGTKAPRRSRGHGLVIRLGYGVGNWLHINILTRLTPSGLLSQTA